MNSEKTGFNLRYRRFWFGLGVVAIVVLAVSAVWYFFNQTTNPHSKPAPQPPVAKQQLKPSSFQRTRNLFGPWELAPANSTGAPRLVMLLASGGTDVSSKVVHVGKKWERAVALEIEAVVVRPHKVIIRALESKIYDLKFRQAFILEPRPETIYSFLPNGPGKALLVSTKVSAQKR